MNASPRRTHRVGIGRFVRFAALVTLFSDGPRAVAGTQQPTPEGVPVGRWFLAPYLVTTYRADSNLFRTSEDPESDTISTFRGGLMARLPVHMSLFELGYEADKVDYAQHSFQRELVQRAAGLFRFSFSTGDELILSDTYTSGFSDVTAINPGGELVFIGEPYDLNDADLVIRRTQPLRAGYEVQLSRVDFSFSGEFDPAQPVPFFDYRGWEGSAEYRQPMGLNRWLTFNYAGRRFDHFVPNDPAQAGIPFRSESGDALGLGLRGQLSGGRPYFLKVGYTKYELTGETPSSLNAFVAEGEIALPVGPQTSVRVNLTRRPFPSTYDTYYLTNYLRAAAERTWRLSRVGVEAAFSYNAYGGPLLDPETGDPATSCGLEIRRDRFLGLGTYLDWLLHPRLALRVTAGRVARESSCGGGAYDATEVFTGVRFGWF